MIYCVAFEEFERFLTDLGFALAGQTSTTLVFLRETDDTALTVRRPNEHGDITELAALAACDAADIEPANFAVHWCDQ